MKYILSFLSLVGVLCAIFFCGSETNTDEDYLRIHITANSSSIEDQNMKYYVKDEVVDFLIPLLAEAQDKEQASKIIEENLIKIKEVVSLTLKKYQISYSANVYISQEDMPTRAYGDLVLEEGIYDCLKIDLGEAKGDNWWCVVFPAVCFINSKNPQNYEYISKIWETIYRVNQR